MSFFNEFKYSLKEDKSDLGGRYFAKVLLEVIRENPWLLSLLHTKISEKIKIENLVTEEFYEGERDKNRRTDLVVYYTDKSANSEILNIEIKWKDKPHKNQIKDYVDKVETTTNQKFLLLSLDDSDFEKGDLDCIDNSKKSQRLTCPKLYDNITKYLIKKQKNNNWLIQQFLEFLKENAMIYNEKINQQALIRFMKNTIAWDHADGFGQNLTNQNIDEYPEMLHTLLSNINKVSMDIYQKDYNENNNNRPYTDFFVETSGADYMEHQAGHFACRTGRGANEGKFIIQSRFKKANTYYSYGIYFYVHNINKAEKNCKNNEIKEKQPRYEIDLYTFANIYAGNKHKDGAKIGYNEKKYKSFSISELNNEGCIRLPKATELEKAVKDNIEKASK